MTITTTYSNVSSFPSSYYVATSTLSASGQTTLAIPPMSLDVGGVSLQSESASSLDVNTAANWDSVSPADYSTAANRAGKDFYLYACQPTTGIIPKYVLSINATYPAGYTSSNSRKIGGFHGLCASVGTIANHTLTGYLTGAILPQSVWCLKHRAKASSNAGLVYIPPLKLWSAIYLTSGSSSVPTIVFGGTILDAITYFVSSSAARVLKMRLPSDYEFGVLAEGSNQGTNILGSADPVTVTAAVDTNGRRMISHYGVESAAGVMWQWLNTSGYRFDGAATHTHTYSSITGDAGSYTSGTASADVAPGWSYKAQTGGKGSLYTQGTYGSTKLIAGGNWNAAPNCGSRARYAGYSPWDASTYFGFRCITSTIEK